jgi:hypothetical protein
MPLWRSVPPHSTMSLAPDASSAQAADSAAIDAPHAASTV